MRKIREAGKLIRMLEIFKLIVVMSALMISGGLIGSLRKIERTQTDTATWAASNAGISVEVERLGMITRIVCSVEVTPSATLDGANSFDSLARTVQNMRLEGGGFTYFTLPGDAGGQGGTLWHYYNRQNMNVVGHKSGGVAAPDRSYVPMTFWWHPGSFPTLHGRQNEYDLTALIPALHDSSLRAIWTTGPNTVLDNSTTITSALLRLTLYYVIGKHSEVEMEMAKQFAVVGSSGLPMFDRGRPNAMVPNWQTITHPGTATFTDFQLEQNIPTGGYLRQLWILSQDDTSVRPVRASDEITGVKITLPGQESPIQAFADHWAPQVLITMSEEDDAAQDFGGYAPGGILFKDFRNEGNDLYGLNLEHVSSGSAKVGATVTAYASGDDYLYLFDKLHPYHGLLGFPG